MALLAKFVSTKLLVTIGVLGVATAPLFAGKVSQELDWRIYATAVAYMLFNFMQNIAVAWIKAKHGRNT